MFDTSNFTHRALAEASRDLCQEVAAMVNRKNITTLDGMMDLGKLRTEVKTTFQSAIDQLEGLVLGVIKGDDA